MSFKLLNTTIVSDIDTLQGDTQVNLTVGSTPALTVTDQPPYTQFDFVSNSSGGLLCNFKVPQSESPFDMRIAVGNPNGNFIENKGNLLFNDSTGTLAGQELLLRDSSNPGGAGIALPNTTSGYVSSTLNYYEEFGTDLGVTGIPGGLTTAVRVVRIGKLVTLSWNSISGTLFLNGRVGLLPIPQRFRPLLGNVVSSVPVVSNSTPATGAVNVDTSGVITFSANSDITSPTGEFSAGPAVINSGSISYTVI